MTTLFFDELRPRLGWKTLDVESPSLGLRPGAEIQSLNECS